MTDDDRLAAFRRERDTLLTFCGNLSAAEWDTPSAAPGWRVRDVVAHLGATCHLNFTPGVVKAMRSRNVERLNDELVAARAGWDTAKVLEELTVWSARFATGARAVSIWPLRTARIPVGELGSYPLRVLPSVMTFDFHTHLRHDIAPALGRQAPGTDAGRMGTVLEWMLAMLEQFGSEKRAWLDRPLGLDLTGPGGGVWRITPTGAGRLRITPGTAADAHAQIAGAAIDFPSWATTRSSWRQHDLMLTGDVGYAKRFLDSIDLV